MLKLGEHSTEYFTDAIFGFHAQQAAEKLLKAWLSLLGIKFERTHDLLRLIRLLEAAGQPTVGLEELVELNPFAVQYRYELRDDEDESIERADLIKRIEMLRDQIFELFP